MNRAKEERVKLSAGWLDRASTTCVAIGIVTPVASYMYGGSRLSGWYLAAAVYVWLSFAGGLHWLARRVLGGLEE